MAPVGKYIYERVKTLQNRCEREISEKKNCETYSLADNNVSEEGGGGALGIGAKIPLQPLEKTMV